MSVQSASSKTREYEFLRTEILQYMEEYQTVRNMMYGVTGTILGLNGAMWDNRYIFLLPLVVILPSYIIFYNYAKCVSVASVYMQAFLEESGTEEDDADTYKWEGRHQRFSGFYDKKNLRNSVISHAQHIPYYACAALCLMLFALNAWMDFCNKKVVAPLWLDLIFLVVLSIVCILIFRFYYDVDLDEIKSAWEKVKSEELKSLGVADCSKLNFVSNEVESNEDEVKHMDSLLELLDKYRCHLKRGNQGMADFLADNFRSYLNDLTIANKPSNNPLLGVDMCAMIDAVKDEITQNIDDIVEVFQLYQNGRIISASNKAFEVFERMKPYLMTRYSGAFRLENYYRIRKYYDDNPFPLERKELFHIQRCKNYLVGPERYSLPGHPCLYLASQAELAWYECGCPKKFALAKFDIPQSEDSNLKFIDFSEKLMPLKHSFFCWLQKEPQDKEAIQKYFLKYIYTYPLRAACSVVTEHPEGKFKEEYILSQLLLQWVRNKDDFDGIRYESCSSSEVVKTFGGHNIVLVTKSFDADGYDEKLRESVKVGEPKLFDIDTITCAPELLSWFGTRDIKNEPFFWNMEDTSSDYCRV